MRASVYVCVCTSVCVCVSVCVYVCVWEGGGGGEGGGGLPHINCQALCMYICTNLASFQDKALQCDCHVNFTFLNLQIDRDLLNKQTYRHIDLYIYMLVYVLGA